MNNMEAKLFKIVKDRGLTIGISSDGNVMHVSLIPKSMIDKTVPVSFSCVEGDFLKMLYKALDEMLSMETEMINAEGFKKGIKENVTKKDEPGLFAGVPEKPTVPEPEPGQESGPEDVDNEEESCDVGEEDTPEDTVPDPEPEPEPKKKAEEKKPVKEKKPVDNDEDLF